MTTLKNALLYSAYADEIRPLLRELDIEELPHERRMRPEFIITYGGDGSFLTAEREWPEVPKIVLRRSRVCAECRKSVPRRALESLKKTSRNIKKFPKIVFHFGLTEGVAASDITLRNWHPNQALRFYIEQGKGSEFPAHEIIGDGLVLATTIGASAYYRSITRKEFSSPFGLAFNNPTKPLKPISLAEDFSLTVRIQRENAFLCLDNLPSFWILRPQERFTVTRHSSMTHLVDLLEFYCEQCQKELRF